jgi:hypothetical protein
MLSNPIKYDGIKLKVHTVKSLKRRRLSFSLDTQSLVTTLIEIGTLKIL